MNDLLHTQAHTFIYPLFVLSTDQLDYLSKYVLPRYVEGKQIESGLCYALSDSSIDNDLSQNEEITLSSLQRVIPKSLGGWAFLTSWMRRNQTDSLKTDDWVSPLFDAFLDSEGEYEEVESKRALFRQVWLEKLFAFNNYIV